MLLLNKSPNYLNLSELRRSKRLSGFPDRLKIFFSFSGVPGTFGELLCIKFGANYEA